MRWSIRLQLLLPMVSAVLLASFLATGITAYWIARRVRVEQAERMRRTVQTLADATFPLTDKVLDQMSGLSGAEFVLMEEGSRLREKTLLLEPAEVAQLAAVLGDRRSGDGMKNLPVTLGQRDYLVDFLPISSRSSFSKPATLFVLYPEAQLAGQIRRAVLPALIAGAVSAAIASLITAWLAQRFLRPIHALVARTARIAEGDFTPIPATRGNQELCHLAESINAMAEQLAKYAEQVRRDERLKALGELGAAMAHQLRNAAAGGKMAIELHRRDYPDEKADQSLDVALRQLQLMDSYLKQFLAIGRPEPVRRRRVDLTELIEEVLGLLRPTYNHVGVDLQFPTPAEPFFVQADPESLRQLTTNLIRNAVEAAASNLEQPPRVGLELIRTDEGRGMLTVQDTGVGPPLAVSDRIFEPFVTGKPEGIGLGLFVARRAAEAADGSLEWRRNDGWTKFIFQFPLEGTLPEKF
ncbi:MAG: HAMP domain-containing histidine kinase [Pirellulales bacterium]|nr:HAMP domain-containing histidine kinase [Pirellulales bacterium]